VKSERQSMEQLNYNLLFRWFVGRNMDDTIWDRDGVHEGTASG
jgi:transposase